MRFLGTDITNNCFYLFHTAEPVSPDNSDVNKFSSRVTAHDNVSFHESKSNSNRQSYSSRDYESE